MSVCSFCQGSLFSDLEWKRRNAHHTDLESWTKSLSESCALCQCLWESLKSAVQQAIPEGLKNDTEPAFDFPTDEELCGCIGKTLPIYKVLFKEAYNDAEFLLRFVPIEDNVQNIKLSSSSTKPLSLCEVTFKVIANDYEIPGVTSRTHLRSSTHISESSAQIRKWLKRCESEEHSKCRPPSDPDSSYVPRRLLDLGLENQETVRVFETGHSIKYRRYATLSHCWGPKTRPIKLMLEPHNIQQLMTSIKLDDTFPRNFKEAIDVARAVGLKYIWIDSLCIIQNDDRVDFREEGTKMNQVYGSSYLNIAAAAATWSEGGLFQTRSPKSVQPCTIQTRDMYSEPLTCTLLQSNFWTTELLSEPLYARAWVLQERMLSSRTLHFGRRQLFYQCLSTAACESMPEGIPPVFADQSSRDELQWRQLLLRNTTLSANERVDLQKLWRHAIDTYTRCGMTEKLDKLPAISGLAKVMSERSGEAWEAGLWRSGDFVEQLAWRVVDCRTAKGQLASRHMNDKEIYRAPSWSWASVNGIIKISTRVAIPREYRLEILGSGPILKYVDDDNFGRMEHGYMEVRGRFCEKVVFVRKSGGSFDWTLKGQDCDGRGLFDLIPDEPLGQSGGDDEILEVSILFLFYWVQVGKICGKALALRETAMSNEFVRIGLIDFEGIWNSVWEELMSSTKHDEKCTIILR